MSQAIISLDTEIADLQTQITSNDGGITTNAGDITTNAGNIRTDSEINTLAAALDRSDAGVNTLADARITVADVPGQIAAGIPLLGNAVSKSFNTVYQAASDGFLVVHVNQTSTGSSDVQIQTASDNGMSADVKTFGKIATLEGGTVNSGGPQNMGMIPVKSGRYYKVTQTRDENSTISVQTYFVPLS